MIRWFSSLLSRIREWLVKGEEDQEDLRWADFRASAWMRKPPVEEQDWPCVGPDGPTVMRMVPPEDDPEEQDHP